MDSGDDLVNRDHPADHARERGRAAGRFNNRWFILQVVRYRKLTGEVLLITVALNLLGLVVPRFFQNVIDRVSVVLATTYNIRTAHRSIVSYLIWSYRRSEAADRGGER